MKVAVIGAGIVGVTTAYELAADGHAVTVFERRSAVAAEASFANAGLLAPGYVAPWAAPGMPWKVLSQALRRHAAVRVGGLRGLADLPWLWRWWRSCRPAHYRRNRAALHALAAYSRTRMHDLAGRLQLDFEQSQGCLVLLRTTRDMAAAQPGLGLLQEWGVPHEVLDGPRCHALEPGLNPLTPLAGGIHLPQDGVGNCRQFAHLLKAEAQEAGASFRFDHDVLRLQPGQAPRLDWQCAGSAGSEAFDQVVVCAGARPHALLHGCGLKLPLASVWGYSITAPLRHVEAATVGPRSAVMDEAYKVAVTRQGQRIRVAGGAELGGRAEAMNAAAIATLYRVLDDWFPGATRLREVQVWKGAQAMLPDGPPVLGSSGAPGVWINLGHGSSGWALACGSARVLADQIGGRTPAIDLSGLGLERLRN